MSEQEPLQNWMGSAIDAAGLYSEDEVGEVFEKVKGVGNESEQLKISGQISALSLQARAEIMTRTGIVFGRGHSDSEDFVEGNVQESLKPFTKESVTSVIVETSADKRLSVVAEIANVMRDLRAKVVAVFGSVVAESARRGDLPTDSSEIDELSDKKSGDLHKVFNIVRKLLGYTQRQLSSETKICQSQISVAFSGLMLGKGSQRKMFNWVKKKVGVVTERLEGGSHCLSEEEVKLLTGFFRQCKLVEKGGESGRRGRGRKRSSGEAELMGGESLLQKVCGMTIRLFGVSKSFLGVQMGVLPSDMTRIFWGAGLKGVTARKVTGWFLRERDNLLAKLSDCTVLGPAEIEEFRSFLVELSQSPVSGADNLCKVFNVSRMVLGRRQVEITASSGISLSSLSIITAGKGVQSQVKRRMCAWLLENRDGILANLNRETESLFRPEDILVLKEFLPSLK